MTVRNMSFDAMHSEHAFHSITLLLILGTRHSWKGATFGK